jgi:hypothetical protein
MYLCIYVCVHVYICMYAGMHVCMHACILMYLHVDVFSSQHPCSLYSYNTYITGYPPALPLPAASVTSNHTRQDHHTPTPPLVVPVVLVVIQAIVRAVIHVHGRAVQRYLIESSRDPHTSSGMVCIDARIV